MTSTPPDFASFRFSSADWPERDRLTIWREAVGRTLGKFDTTPLSSGPFHCEGVMRALPGLGILSGTNAHVSIAKTRELLDGSDDLVLTVATSGNKMATQRGREVTLDAGDAILMSAAEAGVVTALSLSRFICLKLPRRTFAPLVSRPEGALMRRLPPNTEALRLLTRYVTELENDFPLAMPELQRLIVAHVHDLAALVIGATRDAAALAEGRGVSAARLRAIKADIIENLDHGALMVADVAARQRLTPRHVQRLFETEGTTFSKFVLDQRLTRVHRALTNPRLADRPVSAVAYEAGFGDLSYFNRTFRRRYGVAPSDVRAAARDSE